MDLSYKSASIKTLTEEGQIEAVISTFGRDRDGDIMTREAFAGSEGKSIPMVWSHQWDQPIGKGIVSVKADSAVFTGQFFLETDRGAEAYKAVKAMGALQEYSIGFRIKDAVLGYEEDETGERVYTRTIKDLELFEASPVLVGAALGTHTVGIKAADNEVSTDKAVDVLKTADAAALHTAVKQLREAHKDCGDPDCPLKSSALDPFARPVSPERAKTLQEIAARAARA